MRMQDYLREADPEFLLPTDHLSASQVSMLNRCEEQYRQRYVLNKIERPGAALVVGRAFHTSMEADFSQHIRYRELLPENDLQETYHHAFDTVIEEAGGVDEIVWNDREKPDTVRKIGSSCVSLYHTQVAPRMEPESVEVKFRREVEPGLEVEGVIDFIGSQAYREGLERKELDPHPMIADYKTSARTQRTPKNDWKFQGETYQWVTQKPLEWHVAVKS